MLLADAWDELREEADRVQAELAATEQEWQEWVIARRRVDTVLAPGGGNTVGAEAAADPQNADAPLADRHAAKPKTQVPVWRQGLASSVLSVDYQRIVKVLDVLVAQVGELTVLQMQDGVDDAAQGVLGCVGLPHDLPHGLGVGDVRGVHRHGGAVFGEPGEDGRGLEV